MKRGVAEPYARTILAAIDPEQPVLVQLEWGDHQVKQSGGKILNPAGFYVSLVSGNVMPPPNFETAAQRKAREEKLRAQEEAQREQQDLETEYEWYRAQEIDRYIATLDPNEVTAMIEAKRHEHQEKHQSQFMIDSFSKYDAKRELGKGAPLMTLQEFKASREDPPEISLKPVSEPVMSDDFGAEPDVMPIDGDMPAPAAPPPTDFILVSESRETTVEESTRQKPSAILSEPVVELAADFHKPPDSDVAAEAA